MYFENVMGNLIQNILYFRMIKFKKMFIIWIMTDFLLLFNAVLSLVCQKIRFQACVGLMK